MEATHSEKSEDTLKQLNKLIEGSFQVYELESEK